MTKLLQLHDKYTLKILIAFLIIFIALYPKLPSLPVIRTWVYIRLEDFVILATVIIWFIQLLRRKVSIPLPLVSPFLFYWLVGLSSLLFSIFVIGPTLPQVFPHIMILSYLRRIEYMILFFVAFTTIKSSRDVRDYFIILSITVFAAFLYGFGQRYYVYFWEAFPDFCLRYAFCFPSFQTGNEEFAKGIPLCLPPGARISSTFGGHYDLAAYLVLVLPIILGIFVSIKKWLWKIPTAFLFIAGVMLLLFTASRQSFVAYLIAAVFTLVIYKKKWYIIPVVALSMLLLFSFSESTAKRLLSTFRISSVVTTSEGQLVGEALPDELRKKIDDLPTGSSFIGLPGESKTNVAFVKKTIAPEVAKERQISPGTIEISTVSGSFLVRQALVYDISFTTRFQAEWPNAWAAFMRNPLLGSGYSTITLATDNDYLRALGETGILGLFSFIFIFVILGITMKELIPNVTSRLTRGFIFGAAGGVVGLAINAILIDVFEASKVAESLWIFLGIATGGLFLYRKKSLNYLDHLKQFFTSTPIVILFFLFITFAIFASSIINFFVGDDFTWLRWAANGTFSQLGNYFIDSDHFFYRPLDKIITFFLYAVFSFQPEGYHVFMIFLHFIMVAGVYLFTRKVLKKKLLAFLAAVLFMLHPAHAENIYWFSGLSGVLCSTFILYATIAFMHFREKKSFLMYFFALMLSVGAYLSYELAVVTPFLLLATDFFLFGHKRNILFLRWHIPSFVLLGMYFMVRHFSNTFSGGGDYSYNAIHFIPNVFGNFFGYLGLFFAGQRFLPLYQNLRNVMGNNEEIFVAIVFCLMTIFLVIFYSLKKKILVVVKYETTKKILFGLIFAFISLCPFLGLGNIAERYFYLASVGVILSFVQLLSIAIIFVFARRKQFASWILMGCVVLIGWGYYQDNVQLQKEWKHAGSITRNTLGTFRMKYPAFDPSDQLYFYNVPIKYGQAWVFPVGLRDGLWFIYREKTPKVHLVKNFEEAQEIKNVQVSLNGGLKYYIFQFDSKGNLLRIQ